jgi:hypothetical protein
MTEEEWKDVQEALVVGGLRERIDGIIAARFHDKTPPPVALSAKNRKIIERAYDDGEGHGITLVPTEDPPWFAGVYEDSELMLGLEHDGLLYSIVYASGGGLMSVITGSGLLNNEMGIAFHGVAEAKAYVQGLTAAK